MDLRKYLKPLLSCITFCIALPILVLAQNPIAEKGKISGKILDSIHHSPLEFVTITYLEFGNRNPKGGVITDHLGNFELKGLKLNQNYSIQISFIGYKTKILKGIQIESGNGTKSLGIIILKSNSTQLHTVEIQGKKEILENHLDKMVYNAEQDLTVQGGVATDVLKNVPQVSVDIDGNVELAGNSSIQFLINGKPSSAFGSNIADVLQSIPASQIKSIEVLTNPSAKYDGQGLGGIINIILKKNNAQGLNGNISLTAGTRNENGSFNLNYKKGNIGINSFISGNYRPNVLSQTFGDQYRTIDSGQIISHLNQNGNSNIRRGGLESGIGFDWSMDKTNSITGGLNFDSFGRTSSASITQITNEYYSPNSMSILPIFPTSSVLDNTYYRFIFHTIDANLGWKHEFKKEGEELEISLNPSFGTGSNSAENELFHISQTNPLLGYKGDNSQNPGTDHRWELSIDYTNPIKEDLIWAYGAKVDLRKLTSNVNDLSLDSASGIYFYNPYLSNITNYKQQLYALYSEISFPIKKILDLKLGLRYQRTEVQADFSNAPGLANPPGYDSYLPSVFLSHKTKNNQIFKLSFSRRIDPPDYNSLNPYVNTTDPNNLSRGNPYLLPETADRLEFSYSKTFEKIGSWIWTIFYRTSNNDIQPYSVLYPIFTLGNTVYKNVNIITQENVGYEQDAGLNLFANIHLNEKLDLRTNNSVFHRQTTNYIDPGLNAHSFNYRLNFNLAYTLNKTMNAEFSGNFRSAISQVQGHYPAFTSYVLGLRKTFNQKKISLAFLAGNFLDRNVILPTTIQGTNFSSTNTRVIPYRTFGLNFSWKFGSLKFKKDKDEKNPILENSPDGN